MKAGERGVPQEWFACCSDDNELCGLFVALYGDPDGWSEQTWEAYRNTVLHAAAGGAA